MFRPQGAPLLCCTWSKNAKAALLALDSQVTDGFTMALYRRLDTSLQIEQISENLDFVILATKWLGIK